MFYNPKRRRSYAGGASPVQFERQDFNRRGSVQAPRGDSLIVGPHAQDANHFLFGKNFINHAVLNIDTSRVGASKITNQLFEGRRILKRVMGKNRQQF